MPFTLRGKVTLAIPHHFLVALRSTLPHHVVRAPKIGAIKTMKTLRNLFQALAILALGFLVVATIVWLIVDAILGGAQ